MCALTPTELGTVADLLETADRVRPTGIHFSGHGSPGRLQFEDDEGRSHVVAIAELAGDLRRREGLPPFFYLASSRGNEPVVPEEGRSGAESSAAHLHRAGVAQVVGYYGPIHDELSTRAEEALYGARSSRWSRRRRRPRRPPIPSPRRSWSFTTAGLTVRCAGALPVPSGARATGFVGRRTELHRVRQRIRQGEKVFVFQGLGGLGKSTLAFQVLPMLSAGDDDVAVLWGQETEAQPDRVSPATIRHSVSCCSSTRYRRTCRAWCSTSTIWSRSWWDPTIRGRRTTRARWGSGARRPWRRSGGR